MITRLYCNVCCLSVKSSGGFESGWLHVSWLFVATLAGQLILFFFLVFAFLYHIVDHSNMQDHFLYFHEFFFFWFWNHLSNRLCHSSNRINKVYLKSDEWTQKLRSLFPQSMVFYHLSISKYAWSCFKNIYFSNFYFTMTFTEENKIPLNRARTCFSLIAIQSLQNRGRFGV